MSKLAARIHQGRYDSEKELLNLRENAIANSRSDILDAVNMRLKKVSPKVYQRLVGPLHDRNRGSKYKCYCNNPKSLHSIYSDILNGMVPDDALTCDSCWQEDLATTWGYYGYARKLIPKNIWEALCDERGHYKFVG